MWTPALHCTDPEPEPGPGTGCARLWPECQVKWCEGEGPPSVASPGEPRPRTRGGTGWPFAHHHMRHRPGGPAMCGPSSRSGQRVPGHAAPTHPLCAHSMHGLPIPRPRCSWERACRQQRTMRHGTGPCVTLYSARAAAASPGFVALATLPRTKATCRCRCSRCSAYRTEASTDPNRPAIQGAVRAQCTWISAYFRAENLENRALTAPFFDQADGTTHAAAMVPPRQG
jgi:hypothetical protein